MTSPRFVLPLAAALLSATSHMVLAQITPIATPAQVIRPSGPLAGIIALPTTSDAYACEPLPAAQTRDSTPGVRRCSVRTPGRDTLRVDIHIDSASRVILLAAGWPRTTDPDSAVARLDRARAMLEARLGAPITCGRADVAWQQAYHWEGTEWIASLNVTYDPSRDRMGNVQFHARLKAPDELLACMR